MWCSDGGMGALLFVAEKHLKTLTDNDKWNFVAVIPEQSNQWDPPAYGTG
jgi:hypothetical protein